MKNPARSFLHILALLALAVAVLGSPQPAYAVLTVRYVKPAPDGISSGTCDTWANACTLQYALVSVAVSGNHIWLKSGTYYPDVAGFSGTSFVIKPGFAVYGGFAGTEGSEGERIPGGNLTVLSGDIDENDTNKVNGVTPTAADVVGLNSVHVVYMDGTLGTAITASTVLDGLTITAGSNAAGGGGGLYCNGFGTGSVCSPTLSNLAFTGNTHTFAGGGGGAVYNDGYFHGTSSPTFTNVTFSGNHSENSGGAVYNIGGHTLATGSSSPTFTNVTFSGNTAANLGGAVFSSGYSGGISSPIFTNVTFSGNHADNGGAVANSTSVSGISSPIFTDVILWGDTADSGSPEIFDNAATPTISYSVVQGGCASITGASCGSGNLSTDPKLAPLASNGGPTQTMALLSVSPAIDAGNNTVCAAPPVNNLDQRGLSRPIDGNFDATATCDIGAYEYQGHLFADVPVTGKEWMEPWMEMFYYRGITTGCGVGPLYCPETSVTRAAMAVFILRAEHGSNYVPPAATHTFSDMPVAGKEWMEPWVDQLYAEGITSGCGAGPIFCPEAPVTRAAMAVFLLRALEGSSYVPPAATHTFSDMPVAGQGVDGALGGRVLHTGHHHRLWRGSRHLLPGEQRDPRRDGGLHRPRVRFVSINT